MSKILTYILLFTICVSNVAAGVSISEQEVSAQKAEHLNFHRLIDGNSETWDNRWIILVYPEVDSNGQPLSEVCISVNSYMEKLASLCTAINDSEIYGFKRSDIEVGRDIVVSVRITYGAVRYKLKNVLLLKGLDYESFKERYNKRLNSDND
jgi:hypothetical protein